MPLVTLKLWEGNSKETKREIIQNVSKAVAEPLGKPVEHVHVVIHEEPKDNWGLQGDQASEVDK